MSNVYAMRISYVGELGWEFHMPMDVALAVRDDTSGGYGHSVGRYIGFGYLPIDYTTLGTAVTVEYITERYPAMVTEDCLFDPQSERMRA